MYHAVTAYAPNDIQYPVILPQVKQESRPEVIYRPLAPIKVGSRAIVIPVNHYNSEMVTNLGTALTGTVIAHDQITGAFETKRTRYVLDTSYKH